MNNKNKLILQFNKHIELLNNDYAHLRLFRWLIKTKKTIINLYPNKENIINYIWKNCIITYYIIKCQYYRKKNNLNINKSYKDVIINYIICLNNNNLNTFIKKINNTENINSLHLNLFHIFINNSISNEKHLIPFWNINSDKISKQLLIPIPLNYNIENNIKQFEINEFNITQNDNNTYYNLSSSNIVNKCNTEKQKEQNIIKTLKIKLKLNISQKEIINEWINTCNYVYNKTVEYTKNGHSPNFYNLRTLLVTNNTKTNNDVYNSIKNELNTLKKELKKINKDNINLINEYKEKINIKTIEFTNEKKNIVSEKNNLVNEWELNTPKDIRAGAVEDVCNAYKTAFTNLKNGNIKKFVMHFRKKNSTYKSITIASNIIKLVEEKDKKNNKDIKYIQLAPNFLKKDSKIFINKRSLKKNIKIEKDCRLVKKNNTYWLHIPIEVKKKEKTKLKNYCGVDPGIRTFMSTFGNKNITEYKFNNNTINKINLQIDKLKKTKINKKKETVCNTIHRVRNKRKGLNKRELKKENLINELHWKSINHMVTSNDVILYGDIKSHNIVKDNKNSKLNRSFNDMKFYLFKQRLIYKTNLNNKLMFMVNEAYTSQTCSNCGKLNKPGNSKIYNCSNCNNIYDRDLNASKNILIKGIMNNL